MYVSLKLFSIYICNQASGFATRMLVFVATLFGLAHELKSNKYLNNVNEAIAERGIESGRGWDSSLQ